MDSLLSALTVALGLLVIAWLCGPVGPARPGRELGESHGTMSQTSADPEDIRPRVALHVSQAPQANDHVPIALNLPASTTGP